MNTLYSADEFRRRVMEDVATPVIAAWRNHGDYLLNPGLHEHVAALELHDAAVLVPVVDDGPDAKVIFTQRAMQMRKHSGQIAFPGGRRDPEDISAEMAAVREAEEEIGLEKSFIDVIGRLPDYPTPSGFLITPVLAVVRRGFSITPNPAEVDAVFEVPLSFLMDPENHHLESRVWKESERHYYVMPYGERRIWGITAGIVRTLYERLYA